MRNASRLLLLLTALLVFGSCTFRRMIYDYADKLVLFRIDGYLDLRQDQERTLRPQVQDTIAWIKQEKVEEVISLLRELEKAVAARKVDASTISLVYGRFDDWRNQLMARVSSPTAQLLKSLDEDQLNHLQQHLHKAYKPMEKVLAEDQDSFPKALADLIDERTKSLHFWYGDITPEQKRLMMETVPLDRTMLERQLEERKQSHRYFLEELKKRDVQGVRDLIEHWDGGAAVGSDRQYRIDRRLSREKWRTFWIELHKQLKDDQWKHLEKRLREVTQDLEGFAAKEQAT